MAQEIELLQAAFEGSALGMAHLSSDGTFLRVNARLCEMTGYSRAELTGMNFRAVTLADDFGVADEHRRARLASEGGSYAVERRYVRKDGTVFWVHIAVTFIAAPDGSAHYGTSVIEDITQRKNGELRLRRINRLHGVVRAIGEAAAQARDAGALLELACRIAVERGGLRRAEAIRFAPGGTAERLAAFDDGIDAAATRSLALALDAGELGTAARAGRSAACRPPGAPAFSSTDSLTTQRGGVGALASFPLRLGGGEPGALLFAAAEADYFQEDELELLSTSASGLRHPLEALAAEQLRRQAEVQLRRQAVLLTSAENIAGVGSWDYERTSRRLDASSEAERILGFGPGEFDSMASTFIERVHPDDRPAVLARFTAMLANPAVSEIEYRLVRPSGEQRVVLDRGAAIEVAGERITRLAGMLIDITERRLAEQSQRRQSERLAALVQAQRFLAHAEVSTDELFERIPEFLRGVVHCDASAFELVDGDTMVLRSVSASIGGVVGMRFPRADSLSGEALREDRTLHSNDTEKDARVALAVCRQYGLRSVIATVVRDAVGQIGVLKLFGYAPGMFGPADADSLELLAEALGAAIQRRRADDEIARALSVQAGIARIQQEMVGALGDLQAVMDLMAARAHELTGAMSGAVLLIDGDDVHHRAASGIEVGRTGLRFPRAGSLVGLSLERGELLRCDDAHTDPRVNSALARDFGPRSCLSAPFRVGDEIVGALVVMAMAPHAFGEREEGTLRILAEWMGAVMQRAAAEQTLRSLNETLETRVSERTAALELARHDAEQASRAKSAFVATMSHEIRTPMNGVIGMIDVLERTPLSGEQAKMIGLARDSAQALMAIIEDILDFSKIEAGKVEIESRPMSIPETITKACALVESLARSHGVALTVRVDAALSRTVRGDAMRLRQVLLNLVNNAIKFSGPTPGGGRVAVTARRTGDAGRVGAEITIEDNGVGMQAETIGRLFQPFTQADASTTRRFGGTGLGLAISRHLVELMGGEIGVVSAPGAGSTFTVRLSFEPVPVAELIAAPVQPPRPAAPTFSVPLRPGAAAIVQHPELVLVAEDNPINQKVIGEQLKLLGYRAEIADNGREALVLWRSGRFAILVTDLQMPEMDGYELAASIRSEEAGASRLPIVALTANAMKEESGRCLDVGMDGYLTKPAPLGVLGEMLARHLHPPA